MYKIKVIDVFTPEDASMHQSPIVKFANVFIRDAFDPEYSNSDVVISRHSYFRITCGKTEIDGWIDFNGLLFILISVAIGNGVDYKSLINESSRVNSGIKMITDVFGNFDPELNIARVRAIANYSSKHLEVRRQYRKEIVETNRKIDYVLLKSTLMSFGSFQKAIASFMEISEKETPGVVDINELCEFMTEAHDSDMRSINPVNVNPLMLRYNGQLDKPAENPVIAPPVECDEDQVKEKTYTKEEVKQKLTDLASELITMPTQKQLLTLIAQVENL